MEVLPSPLAMPHSNQSRGLAGGELAVDACHSVLGAVVDVDQPLPTVGRVIEQEDIVARAEHGVAELEFRGRT